MGVIVQRIEPNTLFITTVKGAFYVDLERLAATYPEETTGVIYPTTAVTIEYKDRSRLSIEVPDNGEGKVVYERILSEWRNYLLHRDVFENSSTAPKTFVIGLDTLIINWGCHTLSIDLRTFYGVTEAHGKLIIAEGMKKITLTSSKQDYLVSLKETLESRLKQRK